MAVSKRSLAEQIRDTLLQRILDGTYEPDERLVELQLAAEFGSSQAPVREALRQLEGMHYVASRPNRGTRVRRIAPEEMRDAYRVRAGLELVAARAAARIADADWNPLRDAAAHIVAAAAKGDLDAYVRHDDIFHRTLVERARNPVLLRHWEQLAIATRARVVLRAGLIDIRRAAAEHAPIVDALAAGDSARAGSRAFAHASHVADCLDRALASSAHSG